MIMVVISLFQEDIEDLNEWSFHMKFIKQAFGEFSVEINIVVTDVVNDVMYSRKSVNTCVVITLLLHEVIHQKTPTSYDKTYKLICQATSSNLLFSLLYIFSSSEPKAHRYAYSILMLRRPASVRRPQFQRSSPLKPLGQSKPNFIWSILRKGERKFV